MDNIKIGTRASKLAVWQAEQVQTLLQTINISSSIIKIKSSGDKDLSKPVYELGITGVFTKEIDLALLNNEIDIAVHSLKDVPTKLPLGVMQGAVLQRGSELDIIIPNKALKSKENTIATGSLRRKAQWLNKFKTDNIVEIRGNVQTRLRKLNENNWNGTIMAKAGLERLDILPKDYQDLNWMVPAPAQGAISVQNLTLNSSITEVLKQINHVETELCTNIERSFLNKLEGGCTAPIGAHAKIVHSSIVFRGILLSVDGKDKIEINEVHKLDKTEDLGERLAKKIISLGGDRILNSLKMKFESQLWSKSNFNWITLGYSIIVGITLFFLLLFLKKNRISIYLNNTKITFIFLIILIFISSIPSSWSGYNHQLLLCKGRVQH